MLSVLLGLHCCLPCNVKTCRVLHLASTQIHTHICAGVTPQGTKAKRVIAERGQKVVGTKRSNSRENTTVVATINAAGTATPPLIIFKGQRVQAARLGNGGPPGSKFAATDSSFMQGAVFVNYITDFHNFIVENGLADGKPHTLVLDGHASHVNLDVIQLAMTLNIELFQLPSHSSHMTQPLDVAVFGCFKKAVTAVLTSFPLQHGGKMPGKSDMAGVVKDAWAASFTVPQIKASFEGAGLWPVNMDRAINRLHGTGKRKARPDDCPPLADIPLAITEEELNSSLGPRAANKLQRDGHTIAGLRIATVLFGAFLKAQERVTRPAISRSAQGVTAGGLVTCEEVMAKYRADEERKKVEERLREERATARAANRAAKNAAAAARASQRMTGGRGRGHGRGGSGLGGRGGGRGSGSGPAAKPSSTG